MDYQGHQIQADTAGIVRLSTVRGGQWFFFANDPEQLKPLLDRVDGRVQDRPRLSWPRTTSLPPRPNTCPANYAALAFARVDQLVEKLMPRAEEATDDPADQMAAIRQIRSVCGATSFDGGKIRDAIFVGMPKCWTRAT